MIIIDFEFTSLVTKEIVQAKAWNSLTGKSVCENYPTKGPMCASAVVCCGGILKPTVGNMFDSEQFGVLLKRIGGTVDGSFCGFSIKTDKEALAGYRIFLKDYSDVYEMFALNDRYEKRLALEGRSLEALYYMAFKKLMGSSHDGTDELMAIAKLWKKATKLKKRKFMRYYPWGRAPEPH